MENEKSIDDLSLDDSKVESTNIADESIEEAKDTNEEQIFDKKWYI